MRSLWMMGLLSALAACAKEPASLKIKLDKDSMLSAKGEAHLPVFKRRGDTIALRASSFDVEDTYLGPVEVQWTSSDPTVATVDAAGLVTIAGSGETRIAANTTKLEKPLAAELPVQAAIVGAVKITPPSPTFNSLKLGQQAKLTVEVVDDKGKPMPDVRVRWTCPDGSISPEPDGTITADAIGPSVVYAEADGMRGKLELEVLE
jgi:hypothetical protein